MENDRNDQSIQRGLSSITPASLLSTLDKFIYLASLPNDHSSFKSHQDRNASQNNDEAIESALFLLQNLPPARTATLAYLAQALTKQVWLYMQRKESKERKSEYFASQIEVILADLIETSPVIWSPIIARWAVNQLGQWSEWEGNLLSRDATLEERVASWLNCRPAHALANLTVSCVAHDADNTVAALLEASIHNGPALNWLVAHVGCSFPATIVNRVLSLGLRSFAATSSRSQAEHQLSSVDTILNHLAERYFPEIQYELHSVLLSSFTENSDACTKAVVPYLLQLASINRSRAVLRALTASLSQILQQSKNILSIPKQLSWWIPQYFPNVDNLINLLVHLLLDTSGPAACELICILLEGSLSTSDTHGSNFNTQLLRSFLGELTSITYMRRTSGSLRPLIPLLSSLGDENKEDREIGGEITLSGLIDWSIKSDNEIAVRRIGQILTLLICELGPESSGSALQSVLYSQSSVNQSTIYLLNCIMGAIVRHQSFYNCPSKTLTSALSYNLQWKDSKVEILQVVKKLEAMLLSGRTNTSASESLTNAVLANIPCLAKLVNVPELSLSVLELITLLPLESPICLSHLLHLGHAVIFYFFSSIKNHSMKNKQKVSILCNKILFQLSHSSLGHSLLVRLLFEGSFRPEWSHLFGAKNEVLLEFKESPYHLLQTNKQFDSWVKVPQSHNTIFHAGRIGREFFEVQKKKKNIVINQEDVILNTQLLLNLLGTCCRTEGTSQGATTIVLLLVEYISPDIMFNGFPWPEENVKFTFERDLSIKKVFDEFPIAWHYLELVARCRPALCYCSVLVRALTAALTTFWNTCPRMVASQNPDNLKATQRLLEVMVVGQFLPDAFAVLPQMIEHLAPHEIVCILQDVWAYLRDHTPSPDRWTLLPSGLHQRPPDPLDPRYTDRCRKLIHAHIDIFGHLLPCMMQTPS